MNKLQNTTMAYVYVFTAIDKHKINNNEDTNPAVYILIFLLNKV